MLSGRYPSDEFAELRPRLTWDRVNGVAAARQGAKRVAIANAGTIPDRGLYGVFLQGADREHARVGELDEEMVFEARVGETFLLGASTWRIEQITHDRVLVSPAPGQPGKMPFWKGEGPGRPVELGFAIGKLVRELRRSPRQDEATARLAGRAMGSTSARPKTCCSTSTIRRPRRRLSRTTGRSSSRSPGTSSATGALRCCLRSAAACTLRGRWPPPRASGISEGWTSKCCGETKASSFAIPKATRRPTPSLLIPEPGRGRSAGGPAAGIDGALRRAIPRSSRSGAAAAPPAARGHGRRSGSRGSEPPTCWRSPPATARFR